MKQCVWCKETKPRTEFNKRTVAYDGLEPRCRQCSNERQRKWRERNGEKTAGYEEKRQRAADYESKRWHRHRRFAVHGLTPGSYKEILDRQDGRCAICERIPDKSFRVDHDHLCCPGVHGCEKCVRGLLCLNCNASLGGFNDNPQLLRRAATYIESFSPSGPSPILITGN